MNLAHDKLSYKIKIKANKYIFLQCKHIHCLGIDEKQHNQRLSCMTQEYLLSSGKPIWRSHNGIACSHTARFRSNIASIYIQLVMSCMELSTALQLQERSPTICLFSFYSSIGIKQCFISYLVIDLRERETMTYRKGRERTKWAMLFLMPSYLWLEISCLSN